MPSKNIQEHPRTSCVADLLASGSPPQQIKQQTNGPFKGHLHPPRRIRFLYRWIKLWPMTLTFDPMTLYHP
jgi:hypothetical protein